MRPVLPRAGWEVRPRLLLLLSALFLLLTASAEAEEQRLSSFSLVHATLAQERLYDIFTYNHFFEASYLLALRLSREVAGSRRGLSWEIEGQVVKHYGKQHNWEFNGVLVARWNPFPWDRYIDTSVAVGEGLSYATRTPKVEAEEHDRTSKLLNYLLFEVDFGLPAYPRWRLTGMIHHRSGVFGTFNGVHGGSNFMGWGIKHLF